MDTFNNVNSFRLSGTVSKAPVGKMFAASGREGCAMMVKVRNCVDGKCTSESVPVKAYRNSCVPFDSLMALKEGDDVQIDGIIHTYRNTAGTWITELVASRFRSSESLTNNTALQLCQ